MESPALRGTASPRLVVAKSLHKVRCRDNHNPLLDTHQGPSKRVRLMTRHAGSVVGDGADASRHRLRHWDAATSALAALWSRETAPKRQQQQHRRPQRSAQARVTFDAALRGGGLPLRCRWEVSGVSPFSGRMVDAVWLVDRVTCTPVMWLMAQLRICAVARLQRQCAAVLAAAGPVARGLPLPEQHGHPSVDSLVQALYAVPCSPALLCARKPITYGPLTAGLVDRVNALLVGTFWPGVDIGDYLAWPEHTCVARWGALVVGAALMYPEGYLTYVAVRPEWQRHGIASVLVYRCVSSIAPGRDITLHVAANNPAALLYQRFGFKAERFVRNFYDKYLPREDSGGVTSLHAVLMRLIRPLK